MPDQHPEVVKSWQGLLAKYMKKGPEHSCEIVLKDL